MSINSTNWLNLSSKPITLDPDRWYNLSTRRFVRKPPANKDICWSLHHIRVLGTQPQIVEFCELNQAQIKIHQKTWQEMIFQPFEDIAFLSNEANRLTQLGCIVPEAIPVTGSNPVVESTDVEDLRPEDMRCLDKFSWGGLFLKARVREVIDGDTLAVVVYVRLSQLGMGRKVKATTGLETKLNVLASSPFPRLNQPVPLIKSARATDLKRTKKDQEPSSKDQEPSSKEKKVSSKEGFFMLLHIRTYGYDAVEKDQPAGQTARRLLEEKINALKGIIWCRMIDPRVGEDKYDRILAVMYEDPDQTRLLNDYLYRMQKQHKQVYVQPYLGGKKKPF